MKSQNQLVDFDGFDIDVSSDPSLDQLIKEHLDETDAERVILEEAPRSGVYRGRKDNEVRIGLSPKYFSEEIDESFRNFTVAHELGHDKWETAHGNNDYTVEKGFIQRLKDGPTSLVDMTLVEMAAELNALEKTPLDETPDMLDRYPFRDDQKNEFSEFQDLKNKVNAANEIEEFLDELEDTDLNSPREVIDTYSESEVPGVFYNRDPSHSLQVVPEEFDSASVDDVSFTNTFYSKDEDWPFMFWSDLFKQLKVIEEKDIDKKFFLTHYWADKATSQVDGPRNEPQFELLDSFLPDDKESYAGKAIDLHTRVDVRDSFPQEYRIFDSNSEFIFDQLEEMAYQKTVEEGRKIIDRYGHIDELNPDNYPEFVAGMENGSYNLSEVDYPHSVGCSIGKILYDEGISVDEALDGNPDYERKVQNAIEMTARIGVEMENGEEPDRGSYMEELREIVTR